MNSLKPLMKISLKNINIKGSHMGAFFLLVIKVKTSKTLPCSERVRFLLINKYSLNRYGFCKVTGLVDRQTLFVCNMIGKKLKRYNLYGWC